MIRVANTGISAIIDAYGRILQSLPLGEEGLIDGRLPREAAPTVFAAYGALAFPALLALATAMALLRRRQAPAIKSLPLRRAFDDPPAAKGRRLHAGRALSSIPEPCIFCGSTGRAAIGQAGKCRLSLPGRSPPDRA